MKYVHKIRYFNRICIILKWNAELPKMWIKCNLAEFGNFLNGIFIILISIIFIILISSLSKK